MARLHEYQGKAILAANGFKIPTGDGMALVFYTSPEAPLQCAVEISRSLKQHPRLQVRMGIHSGPVSGVMDVNERANLAGAGMNIAQRVMDCGDAGHILLSKRVAEDLEHYDNWRPLLHDLGSCEVKHGVRVAVVNLYADQVGNAKVPLKLAAQQRRTRMRWAAMTTALLALAAIVGGTAIFSRNRAQSILAAPEKSIAVLPFENLSEDKANAYFAEGIQDEILTRLSKIADLKVISRTSTQNYKSAPSNLPEIAKELGVAHILEGSVQKSGDAVRVNVQLIKAATDSHLWADTFDRKLIDVFFVETEVARAIAEQLRVRLTGREQQALAAKPTENMEAYDAYLRGLAYNLKTATTPANSLGAQKYLREAVRLDPKFALAWALLSYVDARGYLQLTLQPTTELREEARRAAETPQAAMLLDLLHPAANNPGALETQAYQAILERRPQHIIPRLKEILAKPDPALGYYNGELRFWLGWAQDVAGDHAAAQETWGQARSELESFLKKQPENFVVIGDLALVCMGLGDKSAALTLAESAERIIPLEKDALHGPIPVEVLTRVAAGTGEPDRAIAAVQKLLSIPASGPLASNAPLTPALLRLDPMFDPLRNDPRFEKLVASPAPK